MAAYESAGETDEWYTPKYIFDVLGVKFDLDVAAPQNGPRHVPAKSWFWENSLEKKWFGFVWMNPPFGHQKQKRLWLNKFFEHGNGIALLPDRTSAPWFQEFVPNSDAQLWVSPKIKFERPDGTIGLSPGTGTVLLGSGLYASKVLKSSRSLGFITITTTNEKGTNQCLYEE
tara:strand:+ start:203 stop:718 length:516 start_codon:yes stop_codon:yes gene_type:complete